MTTSSEQPKLPLEFLQRNVSMEAAAKQLYPEVTFIIGERKDGSSNILVTGQFYASSDFNSWSQLPNEAKANIIEFMHQEFCHYLNQYMQKYNG